jgi:hypothetical protein
MTQQTTQAIVPSEVFAVMDSMDDRAIVERINGRVSKAWVYSFAQGGTTVEGLSAAGVEEAARHLAGQSKGTDVIREISCEVEYEDETEARFIAKAGRYAIAVHSETGVVSEILLDTAVRGKRVDKIHRNGTVNPHWYEHGITKAVRNAKRALLPEELVAAIIENAKKGGRVEPVRQATAAAPVEQPAPSNGHGITLPQTKAIRAMLGKAYPNDERSQFDWMERTQPAAVEGTKVTLGSLTKEQASALITELKALVD